MAVESRWIEPSEIDQPESVTRQQRLTVWRLRQASSGSDVSPHVVTRAVSVIDYARGVKTFCDVGTWQLRYPIIDPSRDVPAPGNVFLFTTGSTTLESGPWTRCEIEYDAATDGLMCSVEGVSEESVLRDRTSYPSPERWAEAQSIRSHDARTGLASTVLIGYAGENTRRDDPVYSGWARDYGLLQTAPDPMLGASISMRERYSNLLDVLQRAALKGGVGFRVVRTAGNNPEFQVYAPRDRSASAVFEVGRGNVAAMSWVRTAPTANVVDAGGQGELTGRMMASDRDNNSIRRWRRRIELFRDQRAEDDKNQLRSDNQAALIEHGEREFIRVTPTASSLARYGEIYELGDLVRARLVARNGTVLKEVVDRVQQVSWSATPAGVTVTPIIGVDGAADLTNRSAHDLSKRLNQIEGAQ